MPQHCVIMTYDTCVHTCAMLWCCAVAVWTRMLTYKLCCGGMLQQCEHIGLHSACYAATHGGSVGHMCSHARSPTASCHGGIVTNDHTQTLPWQHSLLTRYLHSQTSPPTMSYMCVPLAVLACMFTSELLCNTVLWQHCHA